MSETLICTHATRSGSLVEVLRTEPDRVKSLAEVAELTGAVWQCHGCGDGWDAGPTDTITNFAQGHAQYCTATNPR